MQFPIAAAVLALCLSGIAVGACHHGAPRRVPLVKGNVLLVGLDCAASGDILVTYEVENTSDFPARLLDEQPMHGWVARDGASAWDTVAPAECGDPGNAVLPPGGTLRVAAEVEYAYEPAPPGDWPQYLDLRFEYRLADADCRVVNQLQEEIPLASAELEHWLGDGCDPRMDLDGPEPREPR